MYLLIATNSKSILCTTNTRWAQFVHSRVASHSDFVATHHNTWLNYGKRLLNLLSFLVTTQQAFMSIHLLCCQPQTGCEANIRHNSPQTCWNIYLASDRTISTWHNPPHPSRVLYSISCYSVVMIDALQSRARYSHCWKLTTSDWHLKQGANWDWSSEPHNSRANDLDRRR